MSVQCKSSVTQSDQQRSRSTTRRDALLHWGVFIFATCLHGVFITSIWRHDPLVRRPIMDSLYYVEIARQWLTGVLTPPDGGLLLLPPGYPLLLAPILAAAGERLWIVLAIQGLLAAGSMLLLIALAQRFAGRGPAIAVAALVLFYGPYQLYTASILSEALVFPVVLAFFALFESNRYPALQVLLLGYAYLLRPNLGLFVIALLVWLALTDRRRLKTMIWVLVFLALIPAFHAAVGAPGFGGSAQAGAALYLGNHPGADGLFTNDIGVRGDMHQMAAQGVAIARRNTGRELGLKEVNRYWVRRALSWAHEEPLAFASNIALKGLRLIDSHEYATDHQWLDDFPPAARLFPVPFAVFAALSAAGLVGSCQRRFAPYLLFLVTTSAGLLVFYPSSRHRFVLLPVLAVFAARGLRSLARRRPAAIILALAVLCLSAFGVPDDRRREDPFDHFNRARAAFAAGDLDTAESFLDRAMRLRSDVPFLHVLRSEIMERRGRASDARCARRMAFLLGETDPGVINMVASDALQRHQWFFAERVFRRSLELYPSSGAAHMNLAQVLLAQGRASDAATSYQRAVALGSSRRPQLEQLLASRPSRADGD